MEVEQMTHQSEIARPVRRLSPAPSQPAPVPPLSRRHTAAVGQPACLPSGSALTPQLRISLPTRHNPLLPICWTDLLPDPRPPHVARHRAFPVDNPEPSQLNSSDGENRVNPMDS